MITTIAMIEAEIPPQRAAKRRNRVQTDASTKLTGGRSTKYLSIAIPTMSTAHNTNLNVNTFRRSFELSDGRAAANAASLYVGMTKQHSPQIAWAALSPEPQAGQLLADFWMSKPKIPFQRGRQC